MSIRWLCLKWGCLLLALSSVGLAAWFVWQNTALFVQKGDENEQHTAKSIAIDAPLIVERDGERIVWRLRAKKAQQLPSGMRLQKPELELFTARGEITLIRSDIALFDPLKRNIDFRHHVQTTYQDWLLTTERLLYLSQKDTVLVPNAFKINGPDAKISGRGLRANRKTGVIYIDHDVHVHDLQREAKLDLKTRPQHGDVQ
ncbi:MAG: LPS export ABC transporter periplasmic protein LptC [Mariprofundaceae bacterium]|nr:LPS export ABC transporter periplasmic protein LptC [Mariprofundaceae bacterium]